MNSATIDTTANTFTAETAVEPRATTHVDPNWELHLEQQKACEAGLYIARSLPWDVIRRKYNERLQVGGYFADVPAMFRGLKPQDKVSLILAIKACAPMDLRCAQAVAEAAMARPAKV